ncbi:MAG: hypothetical protein NTY02_04870 [Acidobacteria bacterium]|nr:hypothetical protein [Acidobacteriota bacterium]
MRPGPKVSRVSILNDVLGPVMRGPSSSHTAGSYHIAKLVAGLLGDRPSRVRFAFDPLGSYGQVFRQQGVDRGFAVGLMGWDLTDDRFFDSLGLAADAGLDIRFEVRPLAHPDHPNTVEIEMHSEAGRTLTACARSIGGGAVEIVDVEGWPVRLTGYTWELLIDVPNAAHDRAVSALNAAGHASGPIESATRGDRVLLHARRTVALTPELRRELLALTDAVVVRQAPPIAFVKQGDQLFQSAAEMLALADARGWSLGRAALAYEAQLLGMPRGRPPRTGEGRAGHAAALTKCARDHGRRCRGHAAARWPAYESRRQGHGGHARERGHGRGVRRAHRRLRRRRARRRRDAG